MIGFNVTQSWEQRKSYTRSDQGSGQFVILSLAVAGTR